MVQRLEKVVTAHSETGFDAAVAAEAARETLREICQTLGDLLRTVPVPAQRVSMSVGAVSIEVQWPDGGGTPPAQVVVAALPLAAAPRGAAEPPKSHDTVRAPLVGTFYRSPEPGAPPFVAVGDVVEQGQQIGIIEAMKLMNPVEAHRAGVVLDVPVADTQPVEYDQVLLVLDPTEE